MKLQPCLARRGVMVDTRDLRATGFFQLEYDCLFVADVTKVDAKISLHTLAGKTHHPEHGIVVQQVGLSPGRGFAQQANARGENQNAE